MASSALAPLRQNAPPAPPARSEGEALLGLCHDARNLVTALGLCSELLSEPGVLSEEHGHFAGEIRSIAEACNVLVGHLSALARSERASRNLPVDTPVADLAEAVRQLGGLLSAVAGPRVVLQTACLPCAGELRLSEENLTRILLNLVRNAADAMPEGGRIRITAQRGGGSSFLWTLAPDEGPWDSVSAPTVLLTVEDSGPGIPPALVDRIFDPGFSTRRGLGPWTQAPHHGLGLSIVRELVEEAGGSIRAGSAPLGGARFEVELPVRTLTNVTPCLPLEGALSAPNVEP